MPYEFTHMWNLKTMQKIIIITKLKKTLADTENKLLVFRREDGEGDKYVKESRGTNPVI